MAKIEPIIIIKMDPEALDTLKRIADALEAQNASAPDTSFGDQRRLVEDHPASPLPWMQVAQWTPTWSTTGSAVTPIRDGEGDYLLDPKADHTGEETD